MEHVARELGPTIDDLVEIAQQAGETGAKRRTINRWVSKGDVLRPGRVGREWRYPGAAIGQVDTVAHWRQRGVHSELLRFALFIETGTVPPSEAIAIAQNFLALWEEALVRERERLQNDPGALRREAKMAARMRGRAPLPHRVRGISLDERELAMTYALSRMFSVQIPPDEEEQGEYQLERIVGLRSGRGGTERDVSDTALKPDEWAIDPTTIARPLASLSEERIEFARRGVEYMVAWMPALAATLVSVFGAAFTPVVDILRDWSEQLTPDMYVVMFSIFVSNALKRATDEQIHEVLNDFQPFLIAAAMLEDRPDHEVKSAFSQLGPYQRLKLAGVQSGSSTNS